MSIKKILFITLPLIFIFVGVFFAIFYNVPRLTYVYSDLYDGYLVDHAYGDASEYVIPKTYQDKDVVGLNTRAFYMHQNLEELKFEEESNIKYVGRFAFYECNKLKTITLTNLELLEKSAFYDCTSLDNVTIGSTVISGYAFYGCEGLSNLTLVKTDSIGAYAFSGCYSLHQLYLPDTVKRIFSRCFMYSGLNELYASNKLKDNTYLQSLDYVIFY